MTVGIVGKYVEYEDSYKSLNEALLHGGLPQRLAVNLKWIESEGLVGEDWESKLEGSGLYFSAGRIWSPRYQGDASRH